MQVMLNQSFARVALAESFHETGQRPKRFTIVGGRALLTSVSSADVGASRARAQLRVVGLRIILLPIDLLELPLIDRPTNGGPRSSAVKSIPRDYLRGHLRVICRPWRSSGIQQGRSL